MLLFNSRKHQPLFQQYCPLASWIDKEDLPGIRNSHLIYWRDLFKLKNIEENQSNFLNNRSNPS